MRLLAFVWQLWAASQIVVLGIFEKLVRRIGGKFGGQIGGKIGGTNCVHMKVSHSSLWLLRGSCGPRCSRILFMKKQVEV